MVVDAVLQLRYRLGMRSHGKDSVIMSPMPTVPDEMREKLHNAAREIPYQVPHPCDVASKRARGEHGSGAVAFRDSAFIVCATLQEAAGVLGVKLVKHEAVAPDPPRFTGRPQ
jgi:hypothetical protein